MKLRLPKRKAVYVFHVTADLFGVPLWVCKCGHADDELQRAKSIESSIYEKTGKRVELHCVLAVRLFMYRAAEKAVHSLCRPLRTDIFKDASGWTEFFRERNFYCGLVTAILLWMFGIDHQGVILYSVAVVAIPRPLDMAFFVLVLWAFEWAVLAGLIWLACIAVPALIGLF